MTATPVPSPLQQVERCATAARWPATPAPLVHARLLLVWLLLLPLAALAVDAKSDHRVAPPVWAIDPAQPGPDLPPRGRSLFDFVTSGAAAADETGGTRIVDLPFPFAALVRRIEVHAGCGAAPCARQVLVPLGRSLQRLAAAPHFFRHPRVVVAIDTEPERPGPLLKDRIYLGYQERSELIEVISYNEAAARFEFQLVQGYREGGKPQIVYARRAVCIACHQNHAPIFSRQLWDETNANPRVAARLEREHAATYQGVAVRRGVDVPNAIDAATDRANLFGVWQLLWRQGCGGAAEGARCRAALLLAALQYRLSNERGFDRDGFEWRADVAPRFGHQWRMRWAGELALPLADVPNRDPLRDQPSDVLHENQRAVPGLVHVPAPLEPLLPRAPLDTLSVDSPQTTARLVAGLAQFLSAADASAIDSRLASLATNGATTQAHAPCSIDATSRWMRFDCRADGATGLQLDGRVELAGANVRAGKLQRLMIAGAEPLTQLDIRHGSVDIRGGRLQLLPSSGALNARMLDGRRIAAIELQLPAGAATLATRRELHGQVSVSLIDDRAPLRSAIAHLTTSVLTDADLPFQRVRLVGPLLARLGAPVRVECCLDTSGLPPLMVEAAMPQAHAAGAGLPFAPLFTLCASCHSTSERSPPNFLIGSGEQVAAAIRQCAPRIYVRLAQWGLPVDSRIKTPMPPAPARSDGGAARPPADLAGVTDMIATLLQRESGSRPQLDRLLASGYEALPPCLIESGEVSRRP